MKLALMQPYLFPYIGYWQLINAVDVFVLYDDASYRKGGYINRNHIIASSGKQRFTLSVIGASPNKLINQVKVGSNKSKLLRTIRHTYMKAPYFEDVFTYVEDVILNDEPNLARYIEYSIVRILQYIGINTLIMRSSELKKNNDLRGQDKVIDICNTLRATHYINSIGGRALYTKQSFRREGILLDFLDPQPCEYKQFGKIFVPGLSIIDVLMFNSKEDVLAMLGQYELI